ncbi:MAG: hypothetical protein AB7O57_18890 [Hyphomicrobiaceae bacterium]
MSRQFTFETALAGIGRQAIERARHGQELAIQDRLRAHADELRTRVAELIGRKPDPATWTPDEHATFILATEAPTGFEVRAHEPAARSVAPAPPPVRNIDQEIPF